MNAIDDVEDSLKLVDRVRANFPDLPIVSRARNVSHYFELKVRGVQVVERETFESALKAGRAALEMLGEDRYRAKELADAFRRHNIASVDATLPFYQDEASRMSLAKQGREELEKQFARDRERFEREHGGRETMTTWLVSGVRTPFAKVDGPLAKLHAVALSVPVAKAMAAQLASGARPDLMVWGTVAPNLGWSNIAREVLIEAGLDQTTPAFATVLACSTSMLAVFEAACDAAARRRGGDVRRRGEHEPRADRPEAGPLGFDPALLPGAQLRRAHRPAHARSAGARSACTCPSVANRATGKSMGEHCEEMAKQWNIARADQDRIALDSHQRAVEAMAQGILRRPRDRGRGHGEGRHPARRQLGREARVAEARVRPHERQGHHHRGQRVAAHRRRRGRSGSRAMRASRACPRIARA